MLNVIFIAIAFSAAMVTNTGNMSPHKAVIADANHRCEGFVEFWYNLKPHIESRDYNAIADHTQFPFTVQGIADFIAHKKVYREEFSGVLNDILNDIQSDSSDAFDSKVTTTYQILLKATPIKGQYSVCQGEYASIGDLEFKKIDGRWYLYAGYLSTLE